MSSGPNSVATASFDLVDRPWVRVRFLDGRLDELSLAEVFRRAPEIRELAGDIGVQDFAVLRLLLAIVHASLRDEDADPIALWERLRDDPAELAEYAVDYLDEWRDRFDLFDAERPFYQVAGLTTGTEQLFPLERLVVDVPNDEQKQFFTTRAGSGLRELGFGEAARWLVAAQNWDPSGIKTGVLGDARVKGGRGYPIGTAVAASLGALALYGNDLAQTLLLNLVLGDPVTGVRRTQRDDLPVWELEVPPGSGVRSDADGNPASPDGPVSLLTWSSRRMRLQVDGGVVVGCLIANGDPFDPADRFDIEHMTAWRQTAADLKSKSAPVLRPRRHDADRALWRGVAGIVPSPDGTELVGGTSRAARPAGIVSWNELLLRRGLVSPDDLVDVRAFGLKLDSNNAIVQDVFEDRLGLRFALLSADVTHLIAAVKQAARDTEAAVFALGRLAERIAAAAGNRDSDVRSAALAEGFFAVDAQFRRWLVGIGTESDRDSIVRDWHEQARRIVTSLARDLVEQGPPSAIMGRDTSYGHMSTPVAERRFLFDLDEALALSAAATANRARREQRKRPPRQDHETENLP